MDRLIGNACIQYEYANMGMFQLLIYIDIGTSIDIDSYIVHG